MPFLQCMFNALGKLKKQNDFLLRTSQADIIGFNLPEFRAIMLMLMPSGAAPRFLQYFHSLCIQALLKVLTYG